MRFANARRLHLRVSRCQLTVDVIMHSSGQPGGTSKVYVFDALCLVLRRKPCIQDLALHSIRKLRT